RPSGSGSSPGDVKSQASTRHGLQYPSGTYYGTCGQVAATGNLLQPTQSDDRQRRMTFPQRTAADVRFGPIADSCSAATRIVIRSPRRRGRETQLASCGQAPLPL